MISKANTSLTKLSNIDNNGVERDLKNMNNNVMATDNTIPDNGITQSARTDGASLKGSGSITNRNADTRQMMTNNGEELDIHGHPIGDPVKKVNPDEIHSGLWMSGAERFIKQAWDDFQKHAKLDKKPGEPLKTYDRINEYNKDRGTTHDPKNVQLTQEKLKEFYENADKGKINGEINGKVNGKGNQGNTAVPHGLGVGVSPPEQLRFQGESEQGNLKENSRSWPGMRVGLNMTAGAGSSSESQAGSQASSETEVQTGVETGSETATEQQAQHASQMRPASVNRFENRLPGYYYGRKNGSTAGTYYEPVNRPETRLPPSYDYGRKNASTAGTYYEPVNRPETRLPPSYDYRRKNASTASTYYEPVNRPETRLPPSYDYRRKNASTAGTGYGPYSGFESYTNTGSQSGSHAEASAHAYAGASASSQSHSAGQTKTKTQSQINMEKTQAKLAESMRQNKERMDADTAHYYLHKIVKKPEKAKTDYQLDRVSDKLKVWREGRRKKEEEDQIKALQGKTDPSAVEASVNINYQQGANSKNNGVQISANVGVDASPAYQPSDADDDFEYERIDESSYQNGNWQQVSEQQQIPNTAELNSRLNTMPFAQYKP